MVRLVGQSPVAWIAAAVSATSLVMLSAPAGILQVTGLMMLVMCPVMWMAHPASLFEAVMPVDARSVMLTRSGVGLLLTCLPVIAWIVAGRFHDAPTDPVAAILTVSPEYRLLALPVAALAIIVPQLLRNGVLPRPGQPQFPLLHLAALALAAAATIRLLPTGTATIVLAAAVVAAFAVTWHRMPRSFLVAPKGKGGEGRSAPHPVGATSGSRAIGWRPLRATVLPAQMIFAILLVGSMGIGDMWIMYVIIMLFPELAGMARLRFRWMYTLPLSRTALLWAGLTPVALTLLAVLLVGGVIGPAFIPGFRALEWGGRPHEYSRNDSFDPRTMVPLAYWRVAPGRDAPIVRAPWGETAATDTIALPGVTLYNPYSARTGSSPEFLEWQFGRATAAVHGRAFTIAEYEADGFVAPRRVTRTAPVYLLGGSLAVTFVLLMVWLLELVHSHRLATRRVLRYGAGILAGAVPAAAVVLELFFMFTHGTQIVVPVGTALALRLADTLPNLGVVAVVAAIPVTAAYSLLHWQVGQSDIVAAARQG